MIIAYDKIKKIIEKALWYPSGDNCQPWTFEWNGRVLKLIYNLSRAKHPMDPQGICTLLTLGCVLTAIDIAASEFQLVTQFSIENPQLKDQSIWAKVAFSTSTARRKSCNMSFFCKSII